jgi:hypothetical protein
MFVHAAILFIVGPLAVAWLAGASAYLPPYPAPKTEPEIAPQFEAEVRMSLGQHSKSDAAADRRMVPGVRGNALMDGAASGLAANDLSPGPQSRADQGDLAALAVLTGLHRGIPEPQDARNRPFADPISPVHRRRSG